MPEHSFLRLRGLSWWIALAISGSPFNALADDTIQFDGRFLDLKGNTKIDLGRFSQKGYVEPGKYNLRVHVNNQPLPDDYDIYWYATENDPNKSYACLSPELVAQFGLKEDIAKNLQWIRDGQCLNTALLAGTEISGDLGQSALLVSVPQAYLEYTDSEWDPPSRWDDG
ncbi:FimD/PapC N-terminal domain-containing protein, partial [Escherichia coli]